MLKACRVNLGYPDLVCDHMMDKALNSINCGDVANRQASLVHPPDNVTNITTSTFTKWNDTIADNWNNHTDANHTDHDFEMEVCRAERDSQKLGSTISAFIAPFGINIQNNCAVWVILFY